MDENRGTNDARGLRTIPAVSAVLPNGTLVEMVCDLAERRSAFVVWQNGAWHQESSIALDARHRFVPYSPGNNLIRNEVVLLPSTPVEYESEERLVAEVQAFIHRYTDLSPIFEKIASYYVLLSWIYDRFSELPYLRFRGDPGTGKTRSLLIVGSLCYKPIFASGASTVSPLFRILDAVRGTLIIDEGDFRLSDERAELVKILNNGNARGFPVLRSEVTPQREFNPRAYAVFGPKLVATRGAFDDRALESRFLTEEMGHSPLRDDVPISLPAVYKDEALQLRNKLLLFRFQRRDGQATTEDLVDRMIEPRLNQIFMPLLSIVREPAVRAELQELARRYNRELVADRGMDAEAHILEIIRDMLVSDNRAALSVKEITSWFVERHGAEYERKITPKWVGGLIRRRLGLRTQKSHGVFGIPRDEEPRLARLYERYGVDSAEAGAPPQASDGFLA
jgi:hypothetical protein